jgi:SAM-dependent methyltransferase
VTTEQFYDRYWASGQHGNPEWNEAYFRRVCAPLLGRQRVLDYGCGVGYSYQRQLVNSVVQYVGADVGQFALDHAKVKGLATLRIDPATGAVDAPAHHFDGAIGCEVFEHLFDPLQSARELHRVLKPGGALVATVPNFGYHAWRLLALLRAQVPAEPENPASNRFNGVHIRFFSKLMFHRLLRDAGFVDIRIGSFDRASVWDVFKAAGHFGYISKFAQNHFPDVLHLRWLQDVWPNVFAMRLRAVGYKWA